MDSTVDVLSWDYATDAVGNPTAILDLLGLVDAPAADFQGLEFFLGHQLLLAPAAARSY